jgi:hypothetical protein
MTDRIARSSATITMKAHILCWRPNRFWLIGPFVDANAAYAWATDPNNNPADDPNWFVLPFLEDPNTSVEIVSPGVPMSDDDALWEAASSGIN